MSKGLEAVKDLKEQFELLGIKSNPYLKIIENELKDGAKYKQALGIIKKQHLIGGLICTLQATKNYEEFNKIFINQYTKEEHDLLKEVLL